MELSINIVDSDPVVLFNYSDNDGPLDSSFSMVRYGAQPPVLDGYTTMSLMNAKDHMEKGPAYVFHKQFDKLVVLPEETFDDTVLWRQRRDQVYVQNYNFSAAVYAAAGEKPWFCHWNGTLLEGFLFVTEVIETHDTVAKRADVDNDAYGSGDSGWESSSITPSTFQTPEVSATSSSTFANPVSVTPVSRTSSPTGASATVASSTPIPAPPDISVVYSFQSSASSASAASASAALASELSASSTASDFDVIEEAPLAEETPSDFFASYDRYPTVMKIEERRNLDNQAQPYCQQMLIMEDKTVQSIGERIDLTVAEFSEIQSLRSKKRSSNMGKRGDNYGCACEWIIDGP